MMVLTSKRRVVILLVLCTLWVKKGMAVDADIDQLLFESFSQLSSNNTQIQNKQLNKIPENAVQKHGDKVNITPLLTAAKKNWGLLRQQTKDLINPWLLRPTDNNYRDEASWRYTTPSTSIVLPGGHFRVHYVTEVDPITQKDLTSTLSFAQSVAAEAEIVWNKIIGTQSDELGFSQPPTDENNPQNGGDSLYDIYLTNLVLGNNSVIYGYVAPEVIVGDSSYPDKVNSYMVLDNDYSKADFGYSDPKIPMRVTIAHEFFHSVQFGYSYMESAALMESSATWMEDIVYPTIHDNYQYIGEPFDDENGNFVYDIGEPFTDHTGNGYRDYFSPKYPEFPVDFFSSSLPLQYGRFLWFRYLSENFGNDVVLDIWEKYGSVAGDNSLVGMNDVLKSYSSSLPEAYQEYATWGYDLDRFSDGQNYPRVYIDRIVTGPEVEFYSDESPKLLELESALRLRDIFQLHLSTVYTVITSPAGDYNFQTNAGDVALTMLIDTGQASLTHEKVPLTNGRGVWSAPVGALKVIAVISNVGFEHDELYWGICRRASCFSVVGLQEKKSGGCLNISGSDSFLILFVLLSIIYHARKRRC